MKLVFATNNPNKLKEIREKAGKQVEILSLQDIGCDEEIPEDYETLEENALQKARHIYDKYQLNCFADDTGLEITALGNRPGVYSARYAGEHCSPDDNMDKVLDELGSTPNRKAKFRTVIALICNEKECFFEGYVDGEILKKKSGKQGFGYDPIFKPAGFDESFSEMTLEQKNQISHRALAVEKLLNWIRNSE